MGKEDREHVRKIASCTFMSNNVISFIRRLYFSFSFIFSHFVFVFSFWFPYLFDYFDFFFLDKGLAYFLWHPVRPIFRGFNKVFPCLENVHFLCPAFPEADNLWLGFSPFSTVRSFQSSLTRLFSGENSMFIAVFVS